MMARCSPSRIPLRIRGAIAVLAALTVLTVSAQEKQRDIDFDESEKPWREIEAPMPAYPRNEDLLPFEAGGASPHRFFVDAKSLSIGEDGVVRYTLVIRTAGGATNVSFEGIRCDLRQQKYYAVGRADGSWVRARDPQWRRIEYQEVNRHHGVLYEDFLCRGRIPVGSVREAVQLFRYGSGNR
jgi:hypothetical protein